MIASRCVFRAHPVVNRDAATNISTGHLRRDVGSRRRHGGGLGMRPRQRSQIDFDGLESTFQ
jgi:hypothetical protein